MKGRLETEPGDAYRHYACDIRDADAIDKLFAEYEGEIGLVIIHTAAQPSHDWAATVTRRPIFRQRFGHVESAGREQNTRAGCGLYLYIHQQGLWRHPQPTASGGI